MYEPISESTLCSITGYTRRSMQIVALRQMGISYRVNPRGRVIVIDNDLPLNTPVQNQNQEVRLNLDAA